MPELTVEKWLITLAIVNIPLYILWGWIVFTTWANFFECIGFSFTPERKIRFNPTMQVDMFWVKMRIFLLLALCAGSVFGELNLLKKHSIIKIKETPVIEKTS